ncbi:hypothetical protein D3C71_1956260 [compost metagenome]
MSLHDGNFRSMEFYYQNVPEYQSNILEDRQDAQFYPNVLDHQKYQKILILKS